MNSYSVYFESPGRVNIRQQDLSGPGKDEVLVKTELTLVSTGTERLFFKFMLPLGMQVDQMIPVLRKPLNYPLKYGYAAVGRIISAGSKIKPEYVGRKVFAFHAHESLFLSRPEELVFLSDELGFEDGVFLAAMETAVSLIMDGRPVLGEACAVLGQGTIGLLTTALLSRSGLKKLVTIDPVEFKRNTSLKLGADESIAPEKRMDFKECFDLVYELSGEPLAFSQAVQLCCFSGRIIVGSWYGEKKAQLDLGTQFHRNRVHITSSQVGSIDPSFSGSWTKARRISLALEMLEKIKPSFLISHRFDFKDAEQCFSLLDRSTDDFIQAALIY